MDDALRELVRSVTDEKSFVLFLQALRENCETTEHRCEQGYDDCLPAGHFQAQSTKHFLRSMEEWAHGDFIEGEHGDDPILRRVATMLYVGRFLRHEDMPPRQ